jgi:glycosyltransferase involved in cell wall biosynthesis
MRIAFLYGRFSIGQRPFDFDDLYGDPRGLTGSELSCLEYAKAMAVRGHAVTLLVGQETAERELDGVAIRQLDDPQIVKHCDVVYAWNEPNLLREVPPGPLRAVNQQLNDFGYCHPGWEEWADLVTSPSAHHLEFLRKQAPGVRAWEVVPNGCDPGQYRTDRREPGRVIWASSADRGLHRLLEMWPDIKSAAPHATLKCFYNFRHEHFDDYEQQGQNVHPDLLEIAQRKRYIRYAMGKLQGERWGVEHVGSVSRERMAREFEKAEVLAYPCDTIRYTEGFSVTTMEGCASGALPIITNVDALGQIYGGAVPMVATSFTQAISGGATFVEGFTEKSRRAFLDLVVRGLTDPEWRADQAAVCRMLAEQHAWPVLAERLECILQAALQKRGGTKKSKKASSKAPAASAPR